MPNKKTKGDVEIPLVRKSPEAGLSEKKFVETYGDKFKVNLFDKDGNFIFVQTYFGGKDRPVVMFDGSKGKVERITLEELDEKLKVYSYKENPKKDETLSKKSLSEEEIAIQKGSQKRMDEQDSSPVSEYGDKKAYRSDFVPDDSYDELHKIVGKKMYDEKKRELQKQGKIGEPQEEIPAVNIQETPDMPPGKDESPATIKEEAKAEINPEIWEKIKNYVEPYTDSLLRYLEVCRKLSLAKESEMKDKANQFMKDAILNFGKNDKKAEDALIKAALRKAFNE